MPRAAVRMKEDCCYPCFVFVKSWNRGGVVEYGSGLRWVVRFNLQFVETVPRSDVP